MSDFQKIQDTQVYQDARNLIRDIYLLTRKSAWKQEFSLSDQIRRSSVSIVSNIAEGYERDGNAELIQYLSIAKGSTGEMMAQLDVSSDIGLIDKKDYVALSLQANSIAKQLGGWIGYLKKSDYKGIKFKRVPTQKSEIRTQKLQGADNRGFAIISTLLVLTVLTIMVVAFLQSMRIERLTARSYLNKTKADWAAEAALSRATARIGTLKASPAAALFEKLGADDTGYLFLTKRVINPNGIVSYERVPLFSSAKLDADFNTLGLDALETGFSVSDLTTTGAAITHNLTQASEVSVDMNKRTSLYPLGRIGLWQSAALVGPEALPIRVNWIYLNNSEGAVVGRYAYWVDDETAKINLTTAGNLRGTLSPHLREDGGSVDEVSLQPLINYGATAAELRTLTRARMDFIGLGKLFSDTASLRNTTFRYLAQRVFDTVPAGHAPLGAATWNLLRGHTTVQSLEDDRSAFGLRKMNLNAVVTNTTDPARIKQEVEAIRDHILTQLPDFGKRYYQPHDSVTPEDIKIYATKIAVNLRDSIDTDANATVVLKDGSVLPSAPPDPELNGTLPLFGPTVTDLPLAIGKERGPFLSEYTRLMKVISGPSSGTGTVSFTPVHYVELFNPSGREIKYSDLGTKPFVRICNRAPWSYGTSRFRPADIKIYLPDTFSIPAYGYAVLTTDAAPFNGSQTGLLGSAANRYSILKGTAAGNWEAVDTGGLNMPSGLTETYQLSLAAISSNRYGLQSNLRMPTGGYGTNETRIIFGNETGLIDMVVKSYEESNFYLGSGVRNPTMHNSNVGGNNTATVNNGGSSARYSRGDPRSNTEVTAILPDTRSVWIDGLAAYGNNMIDLRVTVGTLNHSTVFLPNPFDANKVLAEATNNGPGAHWVANAPLKSLGELGGIYDPSRINKTHRGGGRTLRIGQSDDWENLSLLPSPNSAANKNEQGGRGTDDISSQNYSRNSFLLLDLFRVDDVTAGRVNLSSVNRSPVPLAFLGTQDGFVFKNVFQGGTAPLADKPLKPESDHFTELIKALREESTNSKPLLNVGEVSRLRIFSEGETLVSSVDMKTVEDKGREEWFRRSANLLCTGSLSYAVHAIGQSGRFINGKFRVEGTAERSHHIMLSPEYAVPYDELKPSAPLTWKVHIRPYEP